jgi:hypothetical protein
VVFDDEGRELRFEIAPHGGVAVERNSLGVFAFVGSVNAFHERLGGRIGRPRAHGRKRDATASCHEDAAARDHDESLRYGGW